MSHESCRFICQENKSFLRAGFEPDLSDLTLVQSSALPTELSKERLQNQVCKEKLFHPKPINLTYFTKFDDSFTFKRGQEDEFPGI